MIQEEEGEEIEVGAFTDSIATFQKMIIAIDSYSTSTNNLILQKVKMVE